jgi:SPP1 gp7 family putative phage head morphogenesis protein
MVTITDVITDARKGLLTDELRFSRRLEDAYRTAWQMIERRFAEIEIYLEDARRAGIPMDERWLREQRWYWQLMASIEREFDRFGLEAREILAGAQRNGVSVGNATVAEINRVLTQPFSGALNVAAFERWVSATDPSSPLTKVVDKYGDAGRDVITRALTKGIASGRGSRAILRDIRRQIDPSQTKPHLESLIRTELMRAYRGSQRDGLESLVDEQDRDAWGWEWLCAKSDRTCAACLGMDGRRFPFSAYPNRFHVNCRCVVRPVPPAYLVPSPERPRVVGDAWLRNQPEKVQRKVLTTPAAYELWKSGVPLGSFVGVRHSATWGDSVYVRSAKDVASSKPAVLPSLSDRAA